MKLKRVFNNLDGRRKFGFFFLQYKYVLPILIIAIGFAYYGLWKTFFFADAWQLLDTYPLMKSYGISYIFQLFPMPYGFHFIPLSMFITTAEAYLFGVNVLGYVIVSLVLHFLNTFLIYYSIVFLSRNKLFALLGALTFAVNAQIREGVYWLTINTWPEVSTSFVLLGLLSFLYYYKSKKFILFFLSLFFFLAAVLSLEYAFMLFPIIVVFLFLMFWKEKRKRYLFLSIIPIVFVAFYFVFRTLILHALNPVVVSAGQTSWLRLAHLAVWYAVTLSPKFIAAIIIPNDILVALASFISRNIYSDITIAQTPVYNTVLFFDQVSIFLGLLFFVCTAFLYIKTKVASNEQKFALQLYGLTYYALPLIFLTLSSYLYWIFSRYLYLPAAIFIIFFFSLIAFIPIMKKLHVISISFSIICCFYILINAFINHTYFSSFVKLSQYRYNNIQRVSAQINWKKRVQVLYIKTSGDIYTNGNDIFGMGTSFGKELLVWNWYQGNNSNYLPSCLFEPLFLFSSPLNGYEECNRKGYGYFQDIKQLKDIMRVKHLNPDDIVALNYDAKTDTLSTIRTEINSKLK